MLSHIYMLCDQSQCTVHSFGAYPSVCGVASDLPNLVGSHNQTEDLLFSYTLSPYGRTALRRAFQHAVSI
jgi:hypothetical protein